jgi:hypothetical protein
MKMRVFRSAERFGESVTNFNSLRLPNQYLQYAHALFGDHEVNKAE